MSVRSGFFNSLNHDRLYDANTVGELFDGMIVDGVYSTIGEKFLVTADSGFRVMVGSGRAWFHHTWTVNDTKLPLYLDTAEQVLPRIDVIVLEINNNEDVRDNTIKIIKGVPASSPVRPELIKSLYVNQYPLCAITIPADSTEITQANIENLVGTDECPFANALLEHVTTSELIVQWKAQWDEYVRNAEKDTAAWTEAFEYRLANWAAGLRDVLDDNQAGHLQNELDALAECIADVEYYDADDRTIVKAAKKYNYGDGIIVNYGDPVSPKLYFAVSEIDIGDEIKPGENVVLGSVMNRINKMHKTNLFFIQEWAWSNDTVSRWEQVLYYYTLKFENYYLPHGAMPDARSCGPTLDTPASEAELEAFNELVDKSIIDTDNKTITLYSPKRLPNFYIAINGIEGDVEGSGYDTANILSIKDILGNGREKLLLSVGQKFSVKSVKDDATTMIMEIVAIDHDADYQRQVVLRLAHEYSSNESEPYPYNNSPIHNENNNTLSWLNTDLGQKLNGEDFWDHLPYSLQSIISEREFYRGEGGAGVTTIRKESAKIWLPRVGEVFNEAKNGSATEFETCNQFELYKTVANIKPGWTMSPAGSNITQYCLIGVTGSAASCSTVDMMSGNSVYPHFHIIGD